MQPELTQPSRLFQFLRFFFLGRQDQMALSAMRWWNYQRLAYNLRLVICLFLGQTLLLLSGWLKGLIPGHELLDRIQIWLYSDLILILVLNLLYFLLPWLEVAVFRGRPERFRAYGFTFLNTINALFVAFALFAAVLAV